MTFLGVGQNIETSGPKSFWKARKEMKEKTSFEPLFETFLREGGGGETPSVKKRTFEFLNSNMSFIGLSTITFRTFSQTL